MSEPKKIPSCGALPPPPRRKVWCFLPRGHAGPHQGARRKLVRGQMQEQLVLWNTGDERVTERPAPPGQKLTQVLGDRPPPLILPSDWADGVVKRSLPARVACPWCHTVCDTQLGSGDPCVGDFTVCIECEHPMVYVPGFAQQLAVAPLNLEACSFQERSEVRKAVALVKRMKDERKARESCYDPTHEAKPPEATDSPQAPERGAGGSTPR